MIGARRKYARKVDDQPSQRPHARVIGVSPRAYMLVRNAACSTGETLGEVLSRWIMDALDERGAP